MRTFDQIRLLALDLQSERAEIIRYMQEIKEHYEGEWVLPLTDVEGEPRSRQMTASLITDTVDSLGMRAASTRYVVSTPQIGNTDTAAERVRTRRRLLAATYHDNRWQLKLRRFYRHMCAYDTASIVVHPDMRSERIGLEVRDPLFTYPEPTAMKNDRAPEYVAFIERRSGTWLRLAFPGVREENGGPITDVDENEQWDILEWHDTDQIVFGLLGPRHREGQHISARYQERYGSPSIQLGPAVPNLAGGCLAVTPQEVSLHTIGNRLNSLLGAVEQYAKLMALEVVAQEKAIFPDAFVIPQDGQTPAILNGEWKDGRTGEMNMLSGVRQVGQINQTPDARTQAMIDRIERNVRVSSGLNPQMGGESFGSLRTGRALDSMMASSVDPRIQELHEVTESWMPWVNQRIFQAYKGYFGSKSFSMYSGWPGDKGEVRFTPDKDIDTVENTVSYAIPGSDTVQLTQILGSMLGAGAISEEAFRRIHPWIDDADAMQDQIVEEQVFQAILTAMQQQIASGQLPMVMGVELYEMVKGGQSLTEAFIEIDERIRQQQAEAAAQAQQQAEPDPLAQLGIAAGPAAAAPTAGPPGAAPELTPGGPAVNMQALLAGAIGGAQ